MTLAIVFDLDGTLIDSAPALLRAANTFLAEEPAAALTLAELTGFIGNGVPKLVERILKARNLTGRDAALARFSEIYQSDPVGPTVLYPGVKACLHGLAAARHPLGICTNKPEAPTRFILAHFGLEGLFGTVIGGDTLKARKPDPAPLRAAIGGLGVEQALFVGDSEVDCATAVAAGQRMALFTRGYRKTPVAELPHWAAFDDFGALSNLVAQAPR